MSLVSRLLYESMYGEPRYKVEFTGIECLKGEFFKCCSTCPEGVDIDEIERYGLAINAAKGFLEKEWFLTESNILVCGETSKSGTLRVTIGMGRKNVDFLIAQRAKRIREGTAFSVIIDGLDIPKGEVSVPIPGLWVNFLGTPE